MNSYEMEPLKIELNAPNGAYFVTVNIKAHSDTVFTVYSQHRNFVVRDMQIKSGEEAEIKFIACVCDRHFHGASLEHVRSVQTEIACDGNLTATAMAEPISVPTLYICGDSTVTDQPAEYPYFPDSTFCGWGQAFGMLTRPTIAVANHAQSGSCTKEFINTNLTAFENKICPGDFMVIEFGHNDQKLSELDAHGGYKKNIIRLAETAKERGAQPIICSPINRIIFESDGHLLNLLGDYRDAAKAAAEETGSVFIDMWKMTTDYFETAGPVKSWQFFRCLGDSRDYTHTNDYGGILISKLFARENLEKNTLLSKHIDPSKVTIEQIYASNSDKADNSAELAHLKTIGLANIPEDIDADITANQLIR